MVGEYVAPLTRTVSPMLRAMAEVTEGMRQVAEVGGLRTQREVLVTRLATAQAHEAELSRRSDEATAFLAKERADVAALEGMSMTRILAGLRGTRDSDLDREQAEALAAAYTAAQAPARLKEATRETASLRSSIHALGDLDRRWESALALRESEKAAGTGDADLARVLPELSAARAQLAEVNEALDAAEHAIEALDAARAKISSAGSWATYDTFFDGGLLTDMVKYNRLDEASALIRRADEALRHLSVELADVGVGGVGEVTISGLDQALDVWFDNIFSDWSVKNRISEAGARIDRVGAAVTRIGGELGGRRSALVVRIDELATERERLGS